MKKAVSAELENGMVVSRDMAEREVSEYLDFKGVRPRRRIEKKEFIDIIIDGVEDGTMSIDAETKVLTHNLIHPCGTSKSFKYAPRLVQGKIAERLRMSSKSDGHSALACYIAELTDNNISVVGLLDTEDNVIASAVAMLFM